MLSSPWPHILVAKISVFDIGAVTSGRGKGITGNDSDAVMLSHSFLLSH